MIRRGTLNQKEQLIKNSTLIKSGTLIIRGTQLTLWCRVPPPVAGTHALLFQSVNLSTSFVLHW